MLVDSRLARRTIQADDNDGHKVPLLNFHDGAGPKLPDAIVEALAKNIASILNGNQPIVQAAVPNRIAWTEIRASAETMPASRAIRFTVAHDGERSELYMRPADGTLQLDERIQSLLIGEKRDGLKAALDLLTPIHSLATKHVLTGPKYRTFKIQKFKLDLYRGDEYSWQNLALRAKILVFPQQLRNDGGRRCIL